MPQRNVSSGDTFYDEIDDVLASPPSNLVRYGTSAFLLVILVLATVLILVQTTDGIECPAVVVSKNVAQIKAPAEESFISKIVVGPGSFVQRGQVVLITKTLMGEYDTLRAPQAGRLTTQRKMEAKDQLDALVPLYLIEPDEKKYAVCIFLPDGINRMQVYPGQKAVLSLEGFSGEESKSLNAEIISSPYVPDGKNSWVTDAVLRLNIIKRQCLILSQQKPGF